MSLQKIAEAKYKNIEKTAGLISWGLKGLASIGSKLTGWGAKGMSKIKSTGAFQKASNSAFGRDMGRMGKAIKGTEMYNTFSSGYNATRNKAVGYLKDKGFNPEAYNWKHVAVGTGALGLGGYGVHKMFSGPSQAQQNFNQQQQNFNQQQQNFNTPAGV